jgi:hypothetical protein
MTMLRTVILGCLLVAGFATTAIFAQPDQPTPAAPSVIRLTQGTSDHFWVMGDADSYHRLQNQAGELAQQYIKADKDESKRELRTKLTDVLNQQFDLHTKQQQKELEDLEKQIAELRTVLKKRQDAKSTIVERRAEQLIQDAQGLGWSSGSNNWFGYTMSGRAAGRHSVAPALPPTPPPAAKAPR